MSNLVSKLFPLVALMLVLYGCKEDNNGDEDTGTDTGTDTIVDTSGDTTPSDTTPADTTPEDTLEDPAEDPTGDPTEDPAEDVSTDVVEEGDAVVEDVTTDMETDAVSDVMTDGDVMDEDVVTCVPSWGLINEFVADETGAEGSADETFIEIRTEAGVDLAGATIEGINGDGGTAFLTVDLTGTVDTDGYFVVAEDASIANNDMVQASLNGLQNGPDNIVLRDSCGNILDAVGYGAFGSSDSFVGEGTAVSMSGEGEALGRCPGDPSSIDTDDNSADFVVISTPTPGVVNPDCT